MTVLRLKPTYGGGHGDRRIEPRREMIAADLGLDLLRVHDPLLLAAGIKAPHLTRGQVASMRKRGEHISEERREKMRDVRRFSRTVAGKAARQDVQYILAWLRRLGEVKGGPK